jgi:hypothetical protein
MLDDRVSPTMWRYTIKERRQSECGYADGFGVAGT